MASFGSEGVVIAKNESPENAAHPTHLRPPASRPHPPPSAPILPSTFLPLPPPSLPYPSRPSPSYCPPAFPPHSASLHIPSAYVLLARVRSSSIWAFNVCLCVCSSSPFLDPWGASSFCPPTQRGLPFSASRQLEHT